MSVLLSDIKLYAAAVTPEDDVATAIGGAIDLTKKFDFSDFTGTCQAVSSEAADTTQSVTLTYRDTAGVIQTLVIALNGLTPVTNAGSIERILKAVKDLTCAGDVALENQTAERTNTLASLGTSADEVVLDAGASAVDGFYNGMVFRATAGAGVGDIAEIINYVGASKTATLSRAVDGVYGFDGTTVFRISKGVFFDKTPSEIMYVVRLDYDSAAEAPGGSDLNFYEKGYFKHTDASGSGLTLLTCSVTEVADPSARVTFALDTAINGSGTNGGGNNRQVAPVAGVTAFDSAAKTVPGGATMAPADIIGVWIALAADAGAAALKTTWTPGFLGTTT
jgi:hypothetical protein